MIEREEYAWVQKLLHWTIALLVVGMIAGGLIMTELGWDDPETAKITNQIYSFHKSAGFLLMALMAARVLARLVYGAPLQEPTIGAAQRFVAGATHLGMYALLVAMPLVGWVATSAGNYLEPIFGLVAMPSLTPAMICDAAAPALQAIAQAVSWDACGGFLSLSGRDQAEALFEIHELIGFGLMGLIGLHILGALFHSAILQDGVMARMAFRRPSPEELG